MQELHSPETYPPETRKRILAMGSLSRAIANRWLLGWPERVRGLLSTGQYLDALKAQMNLESEALSQPGLDHLSSWEKAEVMGLDQSPPYPQTSGNPAPEESSEAEAQLAASSQTYSQIQQQLAEPTPTT